MHMFELDVTITKDGKLAVHHDASVARLCGQNRLISEINSH